MEKEKGGHLLRINMLECDVDSLKSALERARLLSYSLIYQIDKAWKLISCLFKVYSDLQKQDQMLEANKI